jgi:predicted DNA-binding transcriptional regulator AlpA
MEDEKEEKLRGLKRLLSIEETAAFLGISPRSIYNGVAPKSKHPFPIKAKRIGKLVKFDIRDLEAYIAEL